MRSLTECPECGQTVSSLASACPECGTEVTHGARGIGWWIGALLILAALGAVGYSYSSTVSSLMLDSLSLSASGVSPEDLDVGKLDAYQVCQDSLEERLEEGSDTSVSLMPGWVSPGQATDRLSARRFRVESQLGYSPMGHTDITDLEYSCEVRYEGSDDWSLVELTVNEK